jgi:hypothetical protein
MNSIIRTLRRLVPVTLACLLPLVAQPAAAHAGDYAVRLSSTSGSHWTTYGTGPFIASPGKVASGKGSFSFGDYRSWRAQVVGSGSRIIGGRMRVGVMTPHAPMRGRMVVGTGNSPIVVHEEYGTGGVEKDLPAGPYDWVQFDISSTGSVQTTTSGENAVTLQWVDLLLRDSVPPVLEALSLPAPGTWHDAAACVPFAIRLTDQGGGLLRSQVRRAGDGLLVTELGTTQVESLKPGPGEQHLTDCIHPGERGNGDTTFIATAWDVSGVSRELAFTVRADHLAPTIGGGPADGARLTTARPTLAFEVADQGSGLASVSASVNGAGVHVTMSAGVATVHAGELARGEHVIAVAAVDVAGNHSRVQRRITIADDAPPLLVITSPGARGEASVELRVTATDDMSGVDATSWSVLVDDAPVAFEGATTGVTARIGPLAPGAHRIDVAVRDHAGNRAIMTHAYYVVTPPAPQVAAGPAPNPPGRSGAFLVDAPRTAVAFGRTATVSVHVVRDGDAVVGQRVTSRRDGIELASAVTDADGVARVRVPASRPGSYDAIAEGMGFDPVPIDIRVAPRVVITTSTQQPRIGERVRIAGRIFPALRGRTVSVEARVGGVWFPVRRTARTDVRGRFATTVVSASPGPIHVRVKVKPAGTWAGAVSNVRLLQVGR